MASRKTAGQIEDLLKDLRKTFIESALGVSSRNMLGYEKHQAEGRNSGNSRNGNSRKTIKTEESEIEIQVPRDRNGEFEPRLIGKHQRRWDGFDETILALYARGMTTRDIQSFLREKYEIDVSPEFVSSVTESVSAGVQEWRTRPLAPIWPILYLDALFLKVREDGRVVTKALYVAVGVNLEGRKELLGLWLGQSEGAKFYLQIMTELQSRGINDAFIACVDGLKGPAGSDPERLSASDGPDLRRAPGPSLVELCQLQGSQGRGRRFTVGLSGSHGNGSPPIAGAVPDQMGQEVPAHRPFLAGQLGARQAHVRPAHGYSPRRLHDQCHRVSQLQFEKDHQRPQRLSE
jgi:hypothetical protein